MTDQTLINKLQVKVESQREAMIKFLREICAIPSMDSDIEEVGKRRSWILRVIVREVLR